MPTVRRVRPAYEIARPISRLILWRYCVVSYGYMVMIVLAVITLLIIVLSLTTDIPALQTASQNIYVLIGVFVSSGALAAGCLRSQTTHTKLQSSILSSTR